MHDVAGRYPQVFLQGRSMERLYEKWHATGYYRVPTCSTILFSSQFFERRTTSRAAIKQTVPKSARYIQEPAGTG